MATSINSLKRSGAIPSFLLTACAAFLGLGAGANAAIISWDGGGANTNWSTGANWVSNTAPTSNAMNDLEFGSVTTGQLTANNDIASNFQLNSITFNNTAGASFNLTGSSIQFRKDGSTDSTITQNANFAQTIGVAISLQNGFFSLEGNGTGIVTISGVISGISIAKNGTSTYLLTGDNNALNNSTTINGGTIIVGHANALDSNAVTVNSTGALAIASGITYTSALTLNSGSTLAGKGTYTPAAATLTIGGGVTVAPGINDIGTLSIGKSTTLSASSTFAVAVGAGAANNDRLNVTGTLNTGAANALNLSMSGADQGKYTLASATALSVGANTSANGGFGAVTGLNAAYRLNATATAIELIHKATIAIDASPANATIITGGSTSISGHVANIAPINSDALTYTLSGSSGVSSLPGGTLNRTAGDANAAAGALFNASFTSATLGLNNVQLTATGTVASTVTNSPQSASFNVNVLDHASGSLFGSSTNIGTVIVGASIADATFNLQNAIGGRAGLRLTGVTSTNSTLTGPTTIAALAAGGSQAYSASINTGAVGALTASHVFDVEDEALPGAANLPNLTYNITGTVIDHASGSLVGSSTNIGNVIVGASIANATFNLQNAAGSRAGLRLTGVTSSNSALTGPTSIAALAAGGSQAYSASINTGTVGALTASHVFDIQDEALPGATDLASLTYNISGNVFDHAAGSLVGSSTNIGNVIVGASIADATFNLNNAAGFRAGLRLTGVSSTNSALTGPVSIAALAAGANQAYSASINTSSVGALAASHVFDVEDEALPGATDLTSLTYSITGNVLDHAAGSLVGNSTNIGNVIVGASIADSTFNLNNAAGVRVGLRLTGVTSTNSALTGPTSIAALAAGGNQAYSASINTGTVGALVASHVFDVEDEALLGAADLSNLTYDVTGDVLAHSNASFSSASDDNALLIDFGTVALGAGGGTLNSFFDVFALVDVAGYTAGLDLDLLDSTVDFATLAVLGPGSFNLAAGGNQSYTVAFDTNTPGVFTATHKFKLSDENLPGASAPESEVLTLTLTGIVTVSEVPEPATLGTGAFAALALMIRRRKR